MRRLLVLAAAAVAATILTATAVAGPSAKIRHFSWSSMTLTQRIHAQRRLIADDWRVITTWRASALNQLRLVDATIPTNPSWRTASSLVGEEPYAVHWRYRHMKWTQRELAQSLRQFRAVERARASPAVPAGFPPHHALWTCIGRGEGSPTSVNPNGHYGLLQMTYDWMKLIRGRASDYPQAVQEWAAEKAYAANHYSQSFLDDQWLKYDHEYACLAYA